MEDNNNTPMATEQTIVEVVADEAAKRASPNRYVVTKAENLANMLVLVWSLFEETKKQHYLKTLKKLLEDVAPDLKHSPYPAGSKAMKAFYDFDNPMSDSDVMDLKNQFSILPAEVSVDRIQAVRGILQRNGLGNRLPYQGLSFFLRVCNESLQPDLKDEESKKVVECVLQSVVLGNKHMSQSLPLHGSINANNTELVLQILRRSLESLLTSSREKSDALVAQHGGILPHASIQDLRNKLANAPDTATRGICGRQLAALHALVYTSTYDTYAKMLEGGIDMTDHFMRGDMNHTPITPSHKPAEIIKGSATLMDEIMGWEKRD